MSVISPGFIIDCVSLHSSKK